MIPSHSLTDCPCLACSEVRVAAARPQGEVLAGLRERDTLTSERDALREEFKAARAEIAQLTAELAQARAELRRLDAQLRRASRG